MTESSYPLQWPIGRPKVVPDKRDRSAFRTTPAKARDFLLKEIQRLGGSKLVLSTNIPLKKDGTPYAGGYRLDDEGVAVYFDYNGKRVCFACDRWWTMAENMHAIAKTIEALRGVARWGTGDMLDSAVSGFAALPAPIVAGMKKPWRQVMNFTSEPVSLELLEQRYRMLARLRHPDHGGSNAAMAELNTARDEALQELR